jgi:hypothetical protein
MADLLARAGVGEFQLVDADVLSLGNRVRHALGLSDLGRDKASAMAVRLVDSNPWVEALAQRHRVGAVDVAAGASQLQATDDELFLRMQESDLIINASANPVAGAYLSRLGAEASTPVLHAYVSPGAWGARVLLQRPGISGCWSCLGLAQTHPEKYEQPVEIPEVSWDRTKPQIVEQGCADPTFTGPGFDLTAAATAATRIAVQALAADADAYPPLAFDLATLTFRTATAALPSAKYTRLPSHPGCTTCNPA